MRGRESEKNCRVEFIRPPELGRINSAHFLTFSKTIADEIRSYRVGGNLDASVALPDHQ